MKKLTHIIALSITTLLLSCSNSNLNNIEGIWIAEGHNCEDLTGLIEEVNIYNKGNHIYAIKLTGDNCIPAGDTTWYGEIIGDKIIGKAKGMNPQTREIEWIKCEVYKNMSLLHLSVDKNLALIMKKK